MTRSPMRKSVRLFLASMPGQCCQREVLIAHAMACGATRNAAWKAIAEMARLGDLAQVGDRVRLVRAGRQQVEPARMAFLDDILGGIARPAFVPRGRVHKMEDSARE